MDKVRIGLSGHEYRYEVFQILSLFYNKDDIFFCNELDDDYDISSAVEANVVQCTLKNGKEFLVEHMELNDLDKKTIKNAIKTTLLLCLEKKFGIKIPWGILVGIRPTKIVHEYFKNKMDDSTIVSMLENKYCVDIEKASLALEVAKNESILLHKPSRSVSLYIDIPFCPSRCIYCSFTSNPVNGNSELMEQYINALFREIDFTLNELKLYGINIDTVYIGGGTPTALSSEALDRLFNLLGKHLNFENIREFTVEAGRPDSIDRTKLEVIKSYGCSRISINPQSMNNETLSAIGRKHTVSDIIKKFYLAREIGFDNINMDIIIGLPGEGKQQIRNTIKELSSLKPDSVTIHTLAVKRASVLNEKRYMAKDDETTEMYEIASNGVRNMGMFPYYMYRQKNMVSPLENVGFCKTGKECIYNIQMIAENISVVAMGADAVSKIVFENENRIERSANFKDVREYVNRIDEIIERKKEATALINKSFL